MTATSDAAKAMAEAYDACLDVEFWDMRRVWVETLAAIPTELLARVVAERPDGPTPLFEGTVWELWHVLSTDNGEWAGPWQDARVVVLAAPTEDSDHE